MRLVLPITLVVLGGLLALPSIPAAAVLASSGTPDATALSADASLLLQAAVGAILMLAGGVLLILRIWRRRASDER